MKFREMSIDDYNQLIKLWQSSSGIKLRDIDSFQGFKKYLARNKGLSFVAVDKNNNIIGSIMAGHDGKRGYIQKLIVKQNYRKLGIATELLSKCLKALKDEGIIKSHIFVLSDNEIAKNFWKKRGWQKRTDIEIFSFVNKLNLK